ncbi:MAG: hypothetical protein V4672_12920 [Verrucomicrobiota bacterium]
MPTIKDVARELANSSTNHVDARVIDELEKDLGMCREDILEEICTLGDFSETVLHEHNGRTLYIFAKRKKRG